MKTMIRTAVVIVTLAATPFAYAVDAMKAHTSMADCQAKAKMETTERAKTSAMQACAHMSGDHMGAMSANHMKPANAMTTTPKN